MKAQIVSFHCVLKNKLGQVLSSSFNHEVINQIDQKNSTGDRLKGLVDHIQNVTEGERRQFVVPTEEAYGPYDPDLVLNIRRSELSQGNTLTLGSEITSRENGKQLVYRVVQIIDDLLILDGNHPLAGQDLFFDIEVVSARDAVTEDLEDDSIPIAPYARYLH